MVGISYGPAAAYLPEIFETRCRYTAAGLGYNLAGILGGAVPIIIAAQILDAWGSFAIGIYLAGLAALSTACMWALPETKDVDITAPPPLAGSASSRPRLSSPNQRSTGQRLAGR